MAQRVGSITSYKPSDGKGPASFEVIFEGDQYPNRCKAWPTAGRKENPQPNPVIAAIENMRAVDMQGPWLVGGYEKAREGYTNKAGIAVGPGREFFATVIEKAAAGAKHIFDLDKHGNPLDGAPAATTGATAGVGASDDALILVAAAAALGPVRLFEDAHQDLIKINFDFLKSMLEKCVATRADGWARDTPSNEPTPAVVEAFAG
jgi:hypothetical protein